MYQRLTKNVPLFGNDAPWTPRASFLLLVFVWFRELSLSLQMFFLMGRIQPTPKQQVGFVLIYVMWGGWQLLNFALLIGIAYRGNWARMIELIITVFGMVLLVILQLLKHGFDVGLLYLCNAAATTLLFTPSATAWFGRTKAKVDRVTRS
jgi:hypothetical protein